MIIKFDEVKTPKGARVTVSFVNARGDLRSWPRFFRGESASSKCVHYAKGFLREMKHHANGRTVEAFYNGEPFYAAEPVSTPEIIRTIALVLANKTPSYERHEEAMQKLQGIYDRMRENS